MKKVSTAVAMQSRNISAQKLTIGLDLGDRNSWYCVLDEAGQIQLEQGVRSNAKALREVFGAMPRSRIALEIGTHSPWISRLLSELGHEVALRECEWKHGYSGTRGENNHVPRTKNGINLTPTRPSHGRPLHLQEPGQRAERHMIRWNDSNSLPKSAIQLITKLFKIGQSWGINNPMLTNAGISFAVGFLWT